jgi:hypothetical protein
MSRINYRFVEFKMGSSSSKMFWFYLNQHLILRPEMISILICYKLLCCHKKFKGLKNLKFQVFHKTLIALSWIILFSIV